MPLTLRADHFGRLGSDLTTKQAKEKETREIIMDPCKSTDETDVAEALQMRNVLTPDGARSGFRCQSASKNWSAILRLTPVEVSECDSEEAPNEKRVQHFLYPLRIRERTSSYTVSFLRAYEEASRGVSPWRIAVGEVISKQVMGHAFDVSQFEKK